MKLTEKLENGNISLETRIVMPPMATGKSDHGRLTDELISYYADRAANPLVSMIITEHMYITKQGQADANQASVASDDMIEGIRKLADAVHARNPKLKLVAQLNHTGGKADPAITGQETVSSSAYAFAKAESRELTVDEIHAIADAFAAAALRAKEGGYDGVEIHSAHGYLLNQFYSTLVNHRNDEYGTQSMENRLRFHKEVLEKVRAAVGDDYPVLVRLGGCDYAEGGSKEEEAAEAAVLLESYGADLIDISGGMNGFMIPGVTEAGWFANMSEKVRKSVRIPVIVTGGVTTAEEAEQILNDGKADLVGVGRALMKDADWGNH